MKKVGVITCMVVAGVICMISGCRSRQKERNEELVAAYQEEIKAYLEEKYGREFCVSSERKGGEGSPIPFAENYFTYDYIAWEDEEDGYAFWTKIYPVSLDDKNIKEIRDSYCWKFISRKIRDEINKEWKEIIEECKIIILARRDISFGKNINENSGIKDALIDTKTNLDLFIIVPPGLRLDEAELNLEMEKIATDFYNEYVRESGKMLWVGVFETYTKEDYLKIEPEIAEQYRFGVKESEYENKDWIPVDIVPITNVEIKLE